MFSSLVLCLALSVSSAFAAPAGAGLASGQITPAGRRGTIVPGIGAAAVLPLMNIVNCPVTSDVLSLPADQTALAVPDGTKPVAIALGVGTQNYTCTAAGNYTSAGAVATLFDISCLYHTPAFARVQDDIMAIPKPMRDRIINIAKASPLHIGDHYFVANPITGTGISPKFAQVANGGASFTTLAKKSNIKSPAGTDNVDWLQLSSIQGDWATTVFRVDTKLGQPPTSCTGVNSTTTVPYAAKYWFYH